MAQYQDMNSVIDQSSSYCLNECSDAPFTNLFSTEKQSVLKSDADEQLIIHIEFREMVKLHSISIEAPSNDFAPQTMQLFTNRTNLGFSDITDMEPIQSIEFDKSNFSDHVSIPLKFVKFQKVKSITLFVSDNHGEDQTVISSLRFFGQALSGTNMSELKKVG